jgi:dTDP-4-dehydrorhamnose 3,5-epimerase
MIEVHSLESKKGNTDESTVLKGFVMPMPVRIAETEMPGVLLIEGRCYFDDRGFFSEAYSEGMWREAGFREQFIQDNVSLSRRGTLRGMHYQIEPYGIGKFVRVFSGAIFDVGVDLRKGSPTFGGWIGRTLRAQDGVGLYFPSGIAHGFLALEDNSIVYYKCTQMHVSDAERALHYRDPQVGIVWPMAPTVVSEKDAAAPVLEQAEHNFVFQP